MEPCTDCGGGGGGGVTPEQVEALIAEALAPLDDVRIWPGADWMPATGRVFPGRPQQDGDGLLTGVWDGYNLTGIEYADGVDSTACRSLFVPNEWPSMDFHILGIASAFGSGVTKWYRSGDDSTAVEVPVAVFANATLWENVALGVTNPTLGRLLQLPITRYGTDEGGGALAQRFSVLAFYGTPGD